MNLEKLFYLLASIGLVFYITDKVTEWWMGISVIVKALKDRREYRKWRNK